MSTFNCHCALLPAEGADGGKLLLVLGLTGSQVLPCLHIIKNTHTLGLSLLLLQKKEKTQQWFPYTTLLGSGGQQSFATLNNFT